MHPAEVRAEVLGLVDDGLNDAAIARAVGLPRTTVRDMRRVHTDDRLRRATCPRCWRPMRPTAFTAGSYSELLGLYLGDGYIARMGRTHRLRISLDAGHSQIVDDARRLLEECFPHNNVHETTQDDGATVVLSVYSNHLPCLFPHLGPGKKHHRTIALEDWQRAIVDEAPWAFLRGCVHSDGCFFINRTGRYAYLSVSFENASADILQLFAAACRRAGVECRPNKRAVRVYRRDSVRDFAAFVGAKW